MAISKVLPVNLFSIILFILPANTIAADFDKTAQSKTTPYYLSVFGGGSFAQDVDTTLNTTGFAPLDVTQSIDNGFTIGVAAGRTIYDNFRGELEFSFRQNEQGLLSDSNVGSSPAIADGENLNSYSILANIWYDVTAAEQYNVTPYLGGGIGLGFLGANLVDAAVAAGEPEDLTGLGFAFQVGTGVNYDLTDNIQVGAGYRFSGIIADIDGTGANGLTTTLDNAELHSHNVIGSLTYNF